MFDLDDLLAKASAASQGPWVSGTTKFTPESGGIQIGQDVWAVAPASDLMIMHALTGFAGRDGDKQSAADAAFIAAANPTVVTALVNKIRRLDKDLGDVLANNSCTLGIGDGPEKLFVHGNHESIKAAQSLILQAEKDRAELAVTDKLLADRNRVMAAIPGCTAHGDDCIPHAIEWIETAKAAIAEIESLKNQEPVLEIAVDGLIFNKTYKAGTKLYASPVPEQQEPCGYMCEEAGITTVFNAKKCVGEMSSYTPVYKRPVPAQQLTIPNEMQYSDNSHEYVDGWNDCIEFFCHYNNIQRSQPSSNGQAPAQQSQAKLIGHWRRDTRYPSVDWLPGILRDSFEEGAPVYVGAVPDQQAPFCWVWIHDNGKPGAGLFDSEQAATSAWSCLSKGRAIPLYAGQVPAQQSATKRGIDLMSDDDIWHVAVLVARLSNGSLYNISQCDLVTEVRASFEDPDTAYSMLFSTPKPSATQMQWREIGEGDWTPTGDAGWFAYCEKSPEHDTRLVEYGAPPSGVVFLPQNADQAAGMLMLAHAWLKKHAPERLKPDVVEPSGWKLVPVEPTAEQINAHKNPWVGINPMYPANEDELIKVKYGAMLSAAPSYQEP